MGLKWLVPAVLSLCWPSAFAGQAPPAALETVPAAYRTLTRERVFDAVIEAVQQSTVSAQTGGRVVEINFDVDDYVSKGDVILRFRDTEQRARLKAAQAGLSEAQARLAQAEKEFARIKSIYARKLVARSVMDAAGAERKAASARLSAAKAGVQGARERLNHTVVRAPYSGIVTRRQVEIGETARAGQPLMTGLSLEHLRAVVALPQGLVQTVRSDGRARVILPGRAGSVLPTGKLVIFPYADPVTHTFKVRVTLPAGVTGLYPGMLVKVAFVVGEARGLLVPFAAVVHRSEVTGVYVVAPDGRISFRQVRVGRRHAHGIEALAGLEDGERVALDPIRAGVLLKSQRSREKSGATGGKLHQSFAPGGRAWRFPAA